MEDPALLLGIPLALIGMLGLILAVALFAVPEEGAVKARGGAAAVHHGGHPQPSEYVIIGLLLAFITAVEVALYYIELNHNTLIVILIALSSLKFGLVIFWFMHLKFDNKLFTIFFLGGFALAAAVFTVAIATLGGNLI